MTDRPTNERGTSSVLAPSKSTTDGDGENAHPYEGSGTVSVAPVDDAPPPMVPEAAKPVKAVKEWKLRGTVYDLTTLKPLAGCQLTFTDVETNRNISTRSNSEGRYRALVPSLPERGYTVKAEKSGYSPNYLDPGTEEVRAMSAAQRRELAKGLADTLAGTPATVKGVGAQPLITDFFLAPRH